ncbi:MAG: hypothetical protein A3D74_00430 [Candidatus Levybacteria bacterium RIFCSPHIGHO2_02_FULL_37_13]|nr:MAG: hypothetical protein A3D74_00430 [Candidatus Levybacteria bacterium RIFCSPHIGHO2_02_FULL_37_13]OGH37391.1 MAG: hypothetical protein A3B41_03245 [Candidatus Levybacteria bacterium RIFCSPLOWO2_01_FULL_37_26]
MSTQASERGITPPQLPENQQTKETLLDSTHALLAPGQGNQRRGMGLDLANSSGAARGVWKKVDEVLQPDLGYLLSEKVWRGSEADLSDNAQFAVITDALARKAALEEAGLLGKPGWHGGNSLGLITALVNAGSLSVDGAAHLANGRREAIGLVINEAPKTTMVSLEEVDEARVEEVKKKNNLVTCLINTDSQVVIGGRVEDIEIAVQELKGMGERKVFPMEVNAAFHSEHMRKAVPFWTKVVSSAPIEVPKSGIVVGASTGEVRKLLTIEDIKTELILQLTNTERYRDVAKFLRLQGVTQMTELNAIGRLTHMNHSIFGEGSRQRIALPTDTKIAVANRWVAPVEVMEEKSTPSEERVSRDAVKEFYLGWISDRVGGDPKELSEEMSFQEGAGLDSADIMALRAAIRAKYGRNIPDEEAAKILTIEAGIDATYKLMNS